MEHQTNTSIIRNYYAQSMIVHEMGHQWWGDMITCRDWHHIWMNEGFASYVEALWFESSAAFTDLRNYMNGMRYTSGGSIYCTDTTNVWAIFDSRVYDKGAWVLHMLRHVVGDDDLLQHLQTYYDDPRYKWKDVTTEDFRDLCDRSPAWTCIDSSRIGFTAPTTRSTHTRTCLNNAEPTRIASTSMSGRRSRRILQCSACRRLMCQCTTARYIDFQVPMMDREKDYVFDLTNVLSPPTAIAVDRNDWILKTATSEAYAVHVIYDTLKTGVQFAGFQDSVIVRGGTKPYTYQITGGSLPAGLSLNTATGIVSGTPTDTGVASFTVTAAGRPVALMPSRSRCALLRVPSWQVTLTTMEQSTSAMVSI